MPSIRQVNLLILLSVIGLLGYALYTQYFLYLEPCPLCMTQRLFYILLGLFALLALAHTSGRKIYALLGSLSAAAGIATASRQVWLQHLPKEEVPPCGPSLEYMLQTSPLLDTVLTMFKGDGNCAEVVWTFLGFSMGEWSLFCFIGLLLLTLWQLLRSH